MKKDIKYIIKRVISAVLIVLIVGSLKQCKVSALSSSSYYITSNRYSDLGFSTSMPCLTQNSINCFHIIDELSYDNSSIEIYFYNYNYNSNSDYSNVDTISMLFEYNNEYYLFSVIFNTSDKPDLDDISYIVPENNSQAYLFPPNLFAYNSNDEVLYNLGLNSQGAFNYNFYKLDFDNVSYTKLGYNNRSLANDILSNGLLVSTSSPYTIKYNGEEIYVPSPYPTGYEEISLTGNQAVYFVPKDYSNIQIESIQTNPGSDFPLYENYIDFNYYFIGSIKDGYFPLQNLDDITFKNTLFSPLTTLVDSYFPMYEGGNDMSGYQFYSYIIFNNPDDNIDTKIYYNSILFDYYIIDDFYTYNENICTIDRNNDNICFSVDFGSSVSNAWLKGFNDENADFANNTTTEDKISSVFDPIKIPFNWLKSLTNSTCNSLSLPIPFTNSSITLTCLSPRFKQVLGDSFYNIIFYIITGLYAYRITLMNIDTITDVLDPQDDKLEVIEL